MRRSAKILNINHKTVDRKLKYLAKKARVKNRRHLNNTKASTHVVFDDLITKENTKLKPLSVTLAVDEKTRSILALEVSQIPSFGHLAKRHMGDYEVEYWRK